MKARFDKKLEDDRIRAGVYGTREGQHGAFVLRGPCGMDLKIISSGSDSESGWEHVSVSGPNRPPNWQEMCFVKDLFWDPEDVVMQLHPAHSSYVNYHPHCLHLWRPLRENIPLPPHNLVGPLANEGAA